jgi:hypothetical protein
LIVDTSDVNTPGTPQERVPVEGKHQRRRRRTWLIVLLVILAVIGGVIVGFVFWAQSTPPPMPEALAALESDELVTVSQEPWYTFTPVGNANGCGFIFYPGGRVDPRSYAPAARAIAEAGYSVVIPPMPLNLAVLAPNRADEVMTAYPETAQWAIGGHSLGGAMAASYVFDHTGPVQTLILWAAFPAENRSLADRNDLAVTSIYGTLDGLATVDDIEASRALLPPQTSFVPVEGGNHAQFGWYGDQAGDTPATISREEQQTQTVAATLGALEAMCRE